MLDEAIQQVLFQRSDLIEVLNEILGFEVGEKITDFKNWNREDVALIAEKIVVSKDRKLMITFLDGSEVKIKMDVWIPANHYS